MALEAGKLRHRVDIEQPSYTQDPFTGEPTTAWVKVHTSIPCAIEPLSVKEFLAISAEQSEVSARITLRRRDGLTADMRLVGVCSCHSGKIYNPEGWLEDLVSGREYITAPCAQGADEG